MQLSVVSTYLQHSQVTQDLRIVLVQAKGIEVALDRLEIVVV